MANGVRMRVARQRLSGAASMRVPPAPKVIDQAYRDASHAEWSAAVLRRAGGRCQGCGREGVRLFADHIVELKDGGAATDAANGQALCGSCHTAKTVRARAARHRGVG